MRSLTLWEDYNREEIHDIFSPDTAFQPQTGSWGLWGIVKVPDRPGDYVFMVTFGRSQGSHVFDESITDEGVLTWQSQPSQRLTESRIIDFIHHDERVNTIYLFLRTRDTNPYTYLGPIGYLTHDSTREAPVYFQWQLLEWPPPAGLPERIGLNLFTTEPEAEEAPSSRSSGSLTFTEPPAAPSRKGTSTDRFRSKKRPNYAERDARNRSLGLAGEELVLRAEGERLVRASRPDLAERLTHVSLVEGDSAGYDIRSFTDAGETLHIEVKTTRGPAQTEFFVSANELQFSREHADTYALYRVYNYDSATCSAKVYVKHGPLEDEHELLPIQYRVRLRG
jgi:hypothetical protein